MSDGVMFFLILSVGFNIFAFIFLTARLSMTKEEKKFLKEEQENQRKFRDFEYYLKQKEFNAFKEFSCEREDDQK